MFWFADVNVICFDKVDEMIWSYSRDNLRHRFPHTHGKLHVYALLPCFNLFDHLNIQYCRFVYGVRHCDWVMAVTNVLLGFRRTMYVAWVVPRSAVFSELFSPKMSCPGLVSAKLSCPRAGRSSWDVLFLNLPCVPAGPCRSFCPVYLCPHWTMLCVLCCVPVSLLVCAVCTESPCWVVLCVRAVLPSPVPVFSVRWFSGWHPVWRPSAPPRSTNFPSRTHMINGPKSTQAATVFNLRRLRTKSRVDKRRGANTEHLGRLKKEPQRKNQILIWTCFYWQHWRI